jgi:DNA-binding transcriptional LysR family regulator
MNSDQLNGLIALKAVAENRNFTLGAKTLGISPSAISQAIRQLEKRLGVTLLSRTTRSTNLTEAGEKFLREASPAIDQILLAMNNVSSYAEQPSGILRINLPKIAYPNILEPLVTSFIKKCPEVTVELFFEDELSDLVAGGFDAGIRLTELTAKDMVAYKLFGPIKHVVVASPKYLNKMGRPKHPKELLNHNCLNFRFGKTSIYDGWEFEQKGKEFQVQVQGSMISNDTFSLLNAALNDLGVIYFIEEMIEDKLRSKKLEVILEPYACKGDGFYLYYPKASQVLPKLRAFLEHIKEYREIKKNTPEIKKSTKIS